MLVLRSLLTHIIAVELDFHFLSSFHPYIIGHQVLLNLSSSFLGPASCPHAQWHSSDHKPEWPQLAYFSSADVTLCTFDLVTKIIYLKEHSIRFLPGSITNNSFPLHLELIPKSSD